VTASPRDQSPTSRGRQTQAVIDAAARAVRARKGFLAATISDIAGAHRFLDDARDRVRAANGPGLSTRELSYAAAAAHWNTYRDRANVFYRTIYYKETGAT
jgi:hypothetical protein